MPTTLKKCFALLSTLGAVAALYGFGVRPWLLHWGASPAEQTLALPGDGIAPGAVKSTTRGVTIDAPADAVWPWLAQLGQDRAGFYSFEAAVPGRALAFGTWLAGTAHGFQLVTFTQPPALAGALLVAVLAGALLHGARREAWPQIAPSERLDRWLPDAPFRDSIVVASTASNAALMQALFEVSLREMPLARLVGTLRYLPALLGSGEAKRRARLDARRPFVPAVASSRGSVVLEQGPDELVVGTVAKLHQIRDQEPADVRTPAEFAAFAVPNHERLAMSLRTLPWGDRSLLVFEHRTQATDALAHRRFARYWLVIRPGGAFVSRQLLRAVARRAERAAAVGRPAPAVTG